MTQGPLALGSWQSCLCCNGCGMHSLLGVQLEVEERKTARRCVRTEGRSGTEETESEMLAYLHDMDLAMES